MLNELEIRAFFFNAKTDYLPYYKNFTIILEDEDTAADILAKIKEQNENFSYPVEKIVFKVNDLVVEGSQKMDEVVKCLGTSLQVDPVNAYRSVNGLMINDDDFMQSYALLAPYCTSEDLKHYESLYALHYASETSNYKRDYIGDAILVLAHKIITEGSEHQSEILKVISSAESGLLDCEYENNLFDPEDHDNAIESLKEMLVSDDGISLFGLILSKFNGKRTQNEETSEEEVEYHIHRDVRNIENDKVGYYVGNDVINSSIDEEIAKAGGIRISFSMDKKRSGVTLLEDNKDLALTKAGTILLNAIDSGVETLIVENEKDYEMFTAKIGAIECAVNRDIPLNFVLAEDLIYANELVSA